jgi:large subunit ribosomal protein L5
MSMAGEDQDKTEKGEAQGKGAKGGAPKEPKQPREPKQHKEGEPKGEAKGGGAPPKEGKQPKDKAPKEAKKSKEEGGKKPTLPPRLIDHYKKNVIPALKDRFKITNPMAVPRLEKVVVNMGVGQAKDNKGALDAALADLTTITGQKPIITKAKKSISGFKLREGMPIGLKVTLRGRRMWEFLDRLMSIVIPRIKDFRGLPRKAFDGRGNYSMGLAEQIVFPEIHADKVQVVQGMQITIVTTARNDEKAELLLENLGMPFRAA